MRSEDGRDNSEVADDIKRTRILLTMKYLMRKE
jgi:hypothetical protein